MVFLYKNSRRKATLSSLPLTGHFPFDAGAIHKQFEASALNVARSALYKYLFHDVALRGPRRFLDIEPLYNDFIIIAIMTLTKKTPIPQRSLIASFKIRHYGNVEEVTCQEV